MDKNTISEKLIAILYKYRRPIAFLLALILVGTIAFNIPFSTPSQTTQEPQTDTPLMQAIKSRSADLTNRLNSYADAVEAGDYETALADITYLIENDLPNADYYLKRGGLYILTEDYESAKKDLQESIKLSPKQAEVYAMLGQLFMLESNYEDAVLQFENELKLSPSANAHYYLGMCLLASGRTENAAEHLNYVLESDCEASLKETCISLMEVVNGNAVLEMNGNTLEIHPIELDSSAQTEIVSE